MSRNTNCYSYLYKIQENIAERIHFNEIWGMDSFSENQTLTVHVKMLRTKIEENPKEPKKNTDCLGSGLPL